MIYIVDLEAVESRYTGQWKIHVPDLLKKAGHNVQVISGPEDIPSATTPGAFLNFGGTNIYKSAQVEQIGRLFCNGSICANDHFIFTDAWHYHAFDHNYFATDFHIDMFFKNLFSDENLAYFGNKVVRTGWPMEYMQDTLAPYKGMKKRDMILFPHRIAPEKQVEIFRDLAKHLPQYEFVVCQDKQLTKHEYHTLLGEAKMVFSANLQETLGISWYEGAIVDAIPMVPDRLSYSEMAFDTFKYPSKWTESYDAYTVYRPDICRAIMTHMDYYNTRLPQIQKQVESLHEQFFSATNLIKRFV